MRKINHTHAAPVLVCRTLLLAGHHQAEAAYRAAAERLLVVLSLMALGAYVPAVLAWQAWEWVLADLAPANRRNRVRDLLLDPVPTPAPSVLADLPPGWPTDENGIPLAKVAPTPAPVAESRYPLLTWAEKNATATVEVLEPEPVVETFAVEIDVQEVIRILFAVGPEVYRESDTPSRIADVAPGSTIGTKAAPQPPIGHDPLPDGVVPITDRIKAEEAAEAAEALAASGTIEETERPSAPSMKRTKASPDDVRRLLGEGKSQREVAKELGIAQSTVNRLSRRAA